MPETYARLDFSNKMQMNENDNIDSVIKTLTQDSGLAGRFCAPPQAVNMPFAKEHEKFYLCVVPYLVKEAITQKEMGKICIDIVRLLNSAGALAAYDGFELLLCTLHESKTERILRFSLRNTSIMGALSVDTVNLRIPEPIAGSMCVWYVDASKIPAE